MIEVFTLNASMSRFVTPYYDGQIQLTQYVQ